MTDLNIDPLYAEATGVVAPFLDDYAARDPTAIVVWISS